MEYAIFSGTLSFGAAGLIILGVYWLIRGACRTLWSLWRRLASAYNRWRGGVRRRLEARIEQAGIERGIQIAAKQAIAFINDRCKHEPDPDAAFHLEEAMNDIRRWAAER
jgi:hypothetical protein